jgi:UDP-N-acetyl-2-amino-2-deoxyglucuronate dehydrogenase
MGIPNIAVLGTGDSGSHHVWAISESPRAHMHTICSTKRSESTAKALQAKYGADRVTTRYEDVLDDPEIDIVIVCTPNSQHPSQAVPSLEAGKHTYIEKPLAVTLPGAQAIVEAARKSGKMVQVGQDLRFAPMYETIKALVADGRLGKPCYIEGEFVEDLQPNIDGPTHNWYLNYENEGQLPVFCGGGRLLDMMRWVVGEIEEVMAWGTNRNLPKAPWNDTVIANVRFANGALGKFTVCVGARVPPAHNFSYYGSKGTVINNQLFLGGVPHAEDFMTVPTPKKVHPHYVYAAVLDHFLDCIETGARPRIDEVDGARTVAACCAIVKSMESGKPEKVHLIPDQREAAKFAKLSDGRLRTSAE